VIDGVDHDVMYVVVGEGVDDLAASALRCDEVGAPQSRSLFEIR